MEPCQGSDRVTQSYRPCIVSEEKLDLFIKTQEKRGA